MSLTPEEINHIRAWAKSGNEPRWRNLMEQSAPIKLPKGILGFGDVTFEQCDNGYWREKLNSAGLTIAALADALEQACETAEELLVTFLDELDEPLNGLDAESVEAMRANREELLGDEPHRDPECPYCDEGCAEGCSYCEDGVVPE